MAKKKKDEVTTVEAAKMLGVSERTTRRWAKTVLDIGSAKPRGSDKPIKNARRDLAGFYYLRRRELASLGAID